MMRALIHVQHLLGTGHAVRAAAIGRHLRLGGLDVVLVAGNTLPATLDTAGLRIRPLPPARTRDATFSVLVDGRGTAIDEAWRQRRARALMAIYRDEMPDLVITETFPLGRRQFAFELLPLLQAATARRPRPLIACSVRDILVPKTDRRKEAWMADIVNAYYDLVLVHADPALVRLGDSFPYADRIADRIAYTGYVHEPGTPDDGPDGTDEIVVSSGGGPVGAALLEAAILARAHSQRAGDTIWRILVAASHGARVLEGLADRAGPGVVIEPARPDFQSLLSRARASISQAGYNTVLDVLAAGCPAVLAPFEEEAESEQLVRAQLLGDRGLAHIIRESELSPQALAAAVDRALASPGAGRPAHRLRMDGAAAAAGRLISALREIPR